MLVFTETFSQFSLWGRKVAEVYIPEYLFDEYRTHA
jgi:hypothetical protein